MDRRKFVKISAVGSAAVVLDSCTNTNAQTNVSITKTKPIVVSTWKPGLTANKEAWKILFGFLNITDQDLYNIIN